MVPLCIAPIPRELGFWVWEFEDNHHTNLRRLTMDRFLAWPQKGEREHLRGQDRSVGG